MGNIVILDENTSNKIAAGEVIERPASVIKELVENSIDAGATSINVEVKNGGITYIKVSDNGSGIKEDDVEIAFERHATSKIRNADDLDSIMTLGFRGEALSSIAAVSSVELTTRIRENPYGIYINIKGGSVKEVKQVGSPVGTTFVVKDLFYNTPARYKFLKKDSTEFGHISGILNRLALAKPEIAFKLVGNNSIALHTPGNNDLLSVIFSIYGKDVSKNVLPMSFDDGKLKITGYAGKPEISRATRDYQSIFINGRFIKSKIISAAVDEAYKTMMMKNKYPFIVLKIELNPMMVDVNVHPTKMEVRFSDEQEIFRSIYHAVSDALLRTPLIRDIQLAEKSESIFKMKDKGLPKTDYTQQNIPLEGMSVKEAGDINVSLHKKTQIDKGLKSESNDIFGDKTNIIKKEESRGIKADDSGIKISCEKEQGTPDKTGEKPQGNEQAVFLPDEKKEEIFNKRICQKEHIAAVTRQERGDDIIQEKGRRVEERAEAGRPEEKSIDNCLKDAAIVGQVFSTYILLQKENELILIDQHAAHERIMFEKIKNKYQNREPLAQMLIAPVVFDLTFAEIKFLDEMKDYFNKLGFIYESFGNNSIILRAVPDIGDLSSVKELFLEVLDKVLKKNTRETNIIDEETLYTIACKAAVKANKKLDKTEITGILEGLGNMRNPYTCPHGRPVIIKLSKNELEKMFKRIV
jgi:DNA mismatch repair protein MutL